MCLLTQPVDNFVSPAPWLEGFRLHPIWLKRYEQADLAIVRLCEVSSEELDDGEVDDPDGKEDGEKDPVELVEQPQVGSSLKDKSSLSEADEENPVKTPHLEVLYYTVHIIYRVLGGVIQ